MFKLLGIFTCVLVFSLDLAENSNGRECSRFPCDHEIMKKIVEIEHDHDVMKYLLNRYQQMEDTNLETAKILESQDALIRSLQIEVQHASLETQAKFAEQEDAIANNGEGIEKSNASLHETRRMCLREVGLLQEEVKSQGEQIENLKVQYENLTAGVYKPRDCEEILTTNKSARSGVYTIFPKSIFKKPGLSVYCDLSTQGGGWIVLQRRQDGSEDFYRGWQDYKIGFGKLNSEFWLGLDNIHALVSDGKWELLINMRDDVKGEKYAMYRTFSIGPESGGYVLTVGDYSGDAGDSLINMHNGMKFSTKDRDNDASGYSCASSHKGAWWYKNCHYSNLNGVYGSRSNKGPVWYALNGWSNPLEFVEMKMKRKI